MSRPGCKLNRNGFSFPYQRPRGKSFQDSNNDSYYSDYERIRHGMCNISLVPCRPLRVWQLPVTRQSPSKGWLFTIIFLYSIGYHYY